MQPPFLAILFIFGSEGAITGNHGDVHFVVGARIARLVLSTYKQAANGIRMEMKAFLNKNIVEIALKYFVETRVITWYILQK